MAVPITRARQTLRQLARGDDRIVEEDPEALHEHEEEEDGLTAPLTRDPYDTSGVRQARRSASGSSPSAAPATTASQRWKHSTGEILARQHLRNSRGNSDVRWTTDEAVQRFAGSLMLGTGMVLQCTDESKGPGDEPRPHPGFFSPQTDLQAIGHMVFGSFLNVLLVFIPLGFCSYFLKWGAYSTFFMNFISLVPLALMLGEVTEDLAVRFGDTVGGLLNATFGNVVELILSIAALCKGLFNVVAASLMGSILSNLLLVLGCCYLVGGTRYKQQSFSVLVNKAACSLLFLACIALAIPTMAVPLFPAKQLPESAIANMSHATAIMLIFIYACYMLFQLKTHHDLFEGGDNDTVPVLSLSASLGLLTIITIIVAFASEFLTSAIEAVSAKSGLTETFLGLILLPIAGNACEHITAVFVAYKDKLDLSLGVALGSSIQIAIFVIPIVVLVGWAIGQPFYLNINPFLVLVLTLSVAHVYFLSADGQSNWLYGVQLTAVYVLVALLFLFLKE